MPQFSPIFTLFHEKGIVTWAKKFLHQYWPPTSFNITPSMHINMINDSITHSGLDKLCHTKLMIKKSGGLQSVWFDLMLLKWRILPPDLFPAFFASIKLLKPRLRSGKITNTVSSNLVWMSASTLHSAIRVDFRSLKSVIKWIYTRGAFFNY